MDLSIFDEKWVRVLNIIRSFHSDAIIAGGAVRDSVLGAQVRDIDIFIKGNLVRLTEKTYKPVYDVISRITTAITKELSEIPTDVVIEGLSFKNIQCYSNEIRSSNGIEDHLDVVYFDEYISKINSVSSLKDSYTENSSTANISSVVSFRIGTDCFQLIFIECDPIDYVSLCFDYNICKAYTDGTNIVLTDEFWADVDLKFMTLNGVFTPHALAKTISEHGGRLKQKYPGWTLVIGEVSIIYQDEIDAKKKAVNNEQPICQIEPIKNVSLKNVSLMKH